VSLIIASPFVELRSRSCTDRVIRLRNRSSILASNLPKCSKNKVRNGSKRDLSTIGVERLVWDQGQPPPRRSSDEMRDTLGRWNSASCNHESPVQLYGIAPSRTDVRWPARSRARAHASGKSRISRLHRHGPEPKAASLGARPSRWAGLQAGNHARRAVARRAAATVDRPSCRRSPSTASLILPQSRSYARPAFRHHSHTLILYLAVASWRTKHNGNSGSPRT